VACWKVRILNDNVILPTVNACKYTHIALIDGNSFSGELSTRPLQVDQKLTEGEKGNQEESDDEPISQLQLKSCLVAWQLWWSKTAIGLKRRDATAFARILHTLYLPLLDRL
jgi:hypothetical protein